MRRENKYQAQLIDKIKGMLDGCVVIINDPNYIQGLPDLLVLYKDSWAMLEVKRSANEPFQPNQEYYIELFDNMSFADVVYPENEQEVLIGLQQAFRNRR